MKSFKETFSIHGISESNSTKAIIKKGNNSCVFEIEDDIISITAIDGSDKAVVEFKLEDFIQEFKPIFRKIQ